jgi:hypothetical protein
MVGLVFSASAEESKNKDIQFRVVTGLDVFKAQTQKKNSMVMKTGYPIFKGKPLYAGIRVTVPGNTTLHHLLFSFSCASLSSDLIRFFICRI